MPGKIQPKQIMNTLPTDIINFIETHKATIVVILAWLVRELQTFGGIKGMWQFVLTGQMPAKELITTAQIPPAALPPKPNQTT
jgi:hypothetical protein